MLGHGGPPFSHRAARVYSNPGRTVPAASVRAAVCRDSTVTDWLRPDSVALRGRKRARRVRGDRSAVIRRAASGDARLCEHSAEAAWYGGYRPSVGVERLAMASPGRSWGGGDGRRDGRRRPRSVPRVELVESATILTSRFRRRRGSRAQRRWPPGSGTGRVVAAGRRARCIPRDEARSHGCGPVANGHRSAEATARAGARRWSMSASSPTTSGSSGISSRRTRARDGVARQSTRTRRPERRYALGEDTAMAVSTA